jgi:glycerol uptake facilitator-like aquaporin
VVNINLNKGAHFNPAVSFAMLLTGRMDVQRFFIYCTGQFLGAFLGAVMVYSVYLDALKSYGDKMYDLDTAGIFATYPNKSVSTFGCFLDQTFVTSLLGEFSFEFF